MNHNNNPPQRGLQTPPQREVIPFVANSESHTIANNTRPPSVVQPPPPTTCPPAATVINQQPSPTSEASSIYILNHESSGTATKQPRVSF